MTIGAAVLTPALSVLSASYGVQRSLSEMASLFSSSHHTQDSVSNVLQKYVPVPSACVILIGLFVLQPCGSEAMFAGLGHFSKKSIKITFICLIYPLLVICYAGQAAYISKNLHARDFNHLSQSVPSHSKHIFIVLSLLSSAVGSQATITASFSIINQCLALNCFPRVKVIHTSKTIHGQVYIPDVNWLLMIFSLSVTVGFRDLVKIGNATSLAIICGMLVTTSLMSLIIALYWEKNLMISACFLVCFGLVEVAYLSACMLQFHKGAWYLLVLLVVSMTVMLSWHYGTVKKYEFDLQNKVSTEWLIDVSPGLGISRVAGIGFIYTDIVAGIPAFFSHFITNLPAFHQVLIMVSFKSMAVPHVPECERDTGDFEEKIIGAIGEFISIEQMSDIESMVSAEERMMIVGNSSSRGDGKALVPLMNETCNEVSIINEAQISPVVVIDDESDDKLLASSSSSCKKRKKVRFMLPPASSSSPKMEESVRKELLELIDARESGSAYFLGQSHLVVRDGSNYLKRFLIMVFRFFEKNGREPPVALKIPHAALVEV
ncbi:potassium transporter 8-like, partial [Trifolium medium]|nr:potassium transporter 8-like [Trifolium medium]